MNLDEFNLFCHKGKQSSIRFKYSKEMDDLLHCLNTFSGSRKLKKQDYSLKKLESFYLFCRFWLVVGQNVPSNFPVFVSGNRLDEVKSSTNPLVILKCSKIIISFKSNTKK